MLCATSIPSYSTNQNNQPASQPASLAGRPVNTVLTGRMDKPKQSTSQPASQFGRAAGEHGNGRPAGTHGRGRPDGRETNEIANKSPVLSNFDLVLVPLRSTTLSFLSPPLLLMIYFDIDHLLNVTQFLQFLQRFDLSDDLLFLVKKTYICFASATYAKQTGLPPHRFDHHGRG